MKLDLYGKRIMSLSLLILLFVIIINPITIMANDAPSIPVLVSPVNWSTGVDLNVSFDWEDSSDTEDDNFTYTLRIDYVAPDGTSITIEKTDLNLSEYTLHDLGLYTGTQHQWSVKSIQTDTDATLGYAVYWNFQTLGDKYDDMNANIYKVNIICDYNKSADEIELDMWLELNGIIVTGISSPSVNMTNITNSSICIFNTGTIYGDSIYKDTQSANDLNGLYTLHGSLIYNEVSYYGTNYFDASIIKITDKLDTITTTTGSSYVDIQTIMATTNTIDWSDVESIKTKTDTIDWADVDSILTLVGQIKTKTDTILWTDISAIKLKTDTIIWTDVTAIKAKTDTILWTDITAIKTKTDTIDWTEVEYIYTTSGEIKDKTDEIKWSDIDTIRTKTDLIKWSDVTAIKKKTDTILWTDITAIKKKTDTIKWSDVDAIKKKVESGLLSRIRESISSGVSAIKYTFSNMGGATSGIGNALSDILNSIGRFFGNIPRVIGLA